MLKLSYSFLTLLFLYGVIFGIAYSTKNVDATVTAAFGWAILSILGSLEYRANNKQ